MARTKSARRRTAPSAESVLQAAAEVVMTSNAILENHHANAAPAASVDDSENVCEDTLLNGPEGEVVAEIDIDPNDTSLFDDPTGGAADVDMEGDDVNKSLVAASDVDSAVGSDARVDSSFQSSGSSSGNTTSDAPGDGDVPDSVDDPDATGGSDVGDGGDTVSDGDSANSSSVAVPAPTETIHECVSVISDAVHVQKALTCGIVDTQMVSKSLTVGFSGNKYSF